MFELLVLT